MVFCKGGKRHNRIFIHTARHYSTTKKKRGRGGLSIHIYLVSLIEYWREEQIIYCAKICKRRRLDSVGMRGSRAARALAKSGIHDNPCICFRPACALNELHFLKSKFRYIDSMLFKSDIDSAYERINRPVAS